MLMSTKNNVNMLIENNQSIKLNILKGIFGGLLIGICCIMSWKINLLNLQYGFLIIALFFPIGIIMCNICGATLYTGNCIYFMFSKNYYSTIINIIVTIFGNYIGMFILNKSLYYLNPDLINIIPIIYGNNIQLFISGMLCNLLITLSTYIAKISNNKLELIFGMWFPVSIFVLCGFHHGVVVMSSLLFGKVTFINFICILLGNIFGGYIVSILIKQCKYN